MKISGCSNITTLVVLLLLFLVSVQQARAGIYTCWGGCLNQCFYLGTINNNNNRIGARFPCYVNCVATCFYPPPGSRTPPSSPPNPPADKVPAPSPSDSEESFKINKSLRRLDKKKYTCITDCSLQTCHDGSELKNCLTSCIDKCRKLGLNI